MISALNSALQGMQRNQQTMVHHADRVSRLGTETEESTEAGGMVNLQEELVGVMQAQRGFEANLPVLRAADEMLGSLLDILA